VVVALDLEDEREIVTEIDDPSVLSGALEDLRGVRRQRPEIDTRVLVRAVLGPEGGEEPKLGKRRLAAEPPDDAIVLLGCQPVGESQIQRDLRLSRCHSTSTRAPRAGSPPCNDSALRERAILDQAPEERLKDQHAVRATER
jgi:hypothetical protein